MIKVDEWRFNCRRQVFFDQPGRFWHLGGRMSDVIRINLLWLHFRSGFDRQDCFASIQPLVGDGGWTLVGRQLDSLRCLFNMLFYLSLLRRFDSLVILVDSLLRRFDTLVILVDTLLRRFDTQVILVDSLLRRFDWLEILVDSLLRRFDCLEILVDSLLKRFDSLLRGFNSLQCLFDSLMDLLGSLSGYPRGISEVESQVMMMTMAVSMTMIMTVPMTVIMTVCMFVAMPMIMAVNLINMHMLFYLVMDLMVMLLGLLNSRLFSDRLNI
jgi:hypothetical protein